MLVAHVEDSLGGVKVEAGRDQGFGGLPELALLSKKRGAADISGGLRRRQRMASTRKRTSGLVPQILKLPIKEGGNAAFDGGRLLLEVLLSRRNKQNQLSVAERLRPLVQTGGIPKDVAPDNIFQ